MKKLVLISHVCVLAACGQQNKKSNAQQATINSLQTEVDESYKPRFAESMLSIQVHHAKLWFAGQEQNWPLANFALEEMKEGFEVIEKYNSGDEETKSIPMIEPALDSVAAAIRQKNAQLFNSSFVLLTNSCNNCHRKTKHDFNVIRIPTSPPFSNQVFQPQ